MSRRRRLPPITYDEATQILLFHRELQCREFAWKPECTCAFCREMLSSAKGSYKIHYENLLNSPNADTLAGNDNPQSASLPPGRVR